jgi:hypothetical protein
MNSLKLTRRSGRWNLVETFQISSPTTKSAVQNNKLFNVEFTSMNLQKLDRWLDLPKCQDYHGLRSVRYPKRLVDFVARHPYDSVSAVDHERHAIPCSTGHFSIHEEVLQLLPSVEPKRAEPVPGTPISNDQRAVPEIGSHNGHRSIARGCSNSLNARSVSQSGRYDAPCLRHSYFSGHREWIAERGRLLCSNVSGGSFC